MNLLSVQKRSTSGRFDTSKNYNPDVLSCLANLSNDEVFTPPAVVNQMLDLLPQELFRSPATRFLDPVSKTGVFLREIAKRLIDGLADVIPDSQERIDHIMSQQLYGIAITELTALLARRSVYCSKRANSEYSVCSDFTTEDGNIRYCRIRHCWQDGKCRYCGAARSVYDRSADLETHAYEFIHTDKPNTLFNNMKFDVIIGNPPYQLSDGGGSGSSAIPLYHRFIQQAMKLNPRYLTMIIPARWYTGGKGLDEFRDLMLHDKRIRYLIDFFDSRLCFPGVDIAGGVCIFLWDRDHQGTCNVKNIISEQNQYESLRYLDEFEMFIRDFRVVKILHKVQLMKELNMGSMVYSRNPFGFPSTYNFNKTKPFVDSVEIMTSKGEFYVPIGDVSSNKDIIDEWKVVMSKTSAEHAGQADKDGRKKVVSRIEILGKQQICSESYLLIGVTKSKEEAENLVNYIKTRFFRFLLSSVLLTQNIAKDKFQFVPLQDFSRPWTDADLYAKYHLTDDEITFIESMIRPME